MARTSFFHLCSISSLLILLLLISTIPVQGQSDTSEQEIKFLCIADIHFDPFANPDIVQDLVDSEISDWQGIFESCEDQSVGSYVADSNYFLMKSTFDDIALSCPDPSFLLYGGDFLAHRFQRTYSAITGDESDAGYSDFASRTLQFMAVMIKDYFPDTPVYFAIGNNDTNTEDYDIEPGGEFLTMSNETLVGLISNPDNEVLLDEDFPVGGYYSVPLEAIENHRLVVLNTLLFSQRYSFEGDPSENPADKELEWLDYTLYKSRLKAEKVWFLYHIPAGIDSYAAAEHPDRSPYFWREEYMMEFNRIMCGYSDVIEATFTGHTHMDEFHLFYDDETPVAYSHQIPSISPLFGNNPAYQIFEYSLSQSYVTGYATRYIHDLDSIEGLPEWSVEYDFNEIYGLESYTVDSLAELTNCLYTDAYIRDIYLNFYNVSNPEQAFVDDTNWPFYICGISNFYLDGFSTCLEATVTEDIEDETGFYVYF